MKPSKAHERSWLALGGLLLLFALYTGISNSFRTGNIVFVFPAISFLMYALRRRQRRRSRQEMSGSPAVNYSHENDYTDTGKKQ
jgi:hypothetical protein